MLAMTVAPKLKVSLTLSADVVALVDRDARRHEGTRSGVAEQWLRRAAGTSAQREIEDATVAYYLSLRDDEAAEGEALAKGRSQPSRRGSRGKAPKSRVTAR